jgi:membrane-associated protease RseP (regulator of RpoE activity)
MMRAIQSGSRDSIKVSLDGKPPIILPLHRDDLTQRITASGALLPFLPPVAGNVVRGSPADRAGLRKGDTVLTVNGSPVGQWYEMVGLLEHRAGIETRFEIARTAAVANRHHALRRQGEIGREDALGSGDRRVSRAASGPNEPLGIGAALAAGCAATFETQHVQTSGLFAGCFPVGFRPTRWVARSRSDRPPANRPGRLRHLRGVHGPDFGEPGGGEPAAHSGPGWGPVPVPAGGGGLEAPLPLKLRQRLTAVGLVLILLLMALAFSNDIRRIFGLL